MDAARENNLNTALSHAHQHLLLLRTIRGTTWLHASERTALGECITGLEELIAAAESFQAACDCRSLDSSNLPAAYGFCPHCYSMGSFRQELRNGSTSCERGHTYPSSQEVPSHVFVGDDDRCLYCQQKKKHAIHI